MECDIIVAPQLRVGYADDETSDLTQIKLIEKFCLTKNVSFLNKMSPCVQEKFVEYAKQVLYEKTENEEVVNIVLNHFLKSQNRRDVIIKNFNDLIIWQKQERESGYVFKIKNYKKLIDCFENKFVPDWNIARKIIFNCFKNPSSLLDKLKEIWEKGTLERFNNEENTAIENITKIQWIGPITAKKLYDMGCRTIKDIKFMYDTEKITLTRAQEISLKYINHTHEISYENDKEIVKPRRIPREEIDVLNNMFEEYLKTTELVESVSLGLQIKIVGSYRRKLPSSGDIDVLITTLKHDDTVLENIINYLRGQQNGLKIVKIVEGPSKFLGYIKIDKYYRRIDILRTSKKEYPFSVLYFTGSKEFNVRMRSHALKMGYSMNEHGLTCEALMTPEPDYDFETELDIFKFLKYPYVKPSERI
jgi:DNA polymerase/3'-5' exonuclease PolX